MDSGIGAWCWRKFNLSRPWVRVLIEIPESDSVDPCSVLQLFYVPPSIISV
jgi:hypothetical protein